MFHNDLKTDIKFTEDYFANIDLIAKVKGKVFIVHSSNDEIIPFEQVKLLFDKYVEKNKEADIYFIEVAKLKHNALHKYISSNRRN